MAVKELKYATVDGVDIYMDVVVPEGATKEKKAPIYLWFHGGGLLQGTRKGFPHHWESAPSKHGLCAVSPDYRLAPQARFPAIMEDCYNVITFIHSPEFEKATEGKVDTSRICVSGGSAGGWLALLVGLGIGFEESGLKRPKEVQSIASIYPISDLNDPFWHTKQHPVSYFPRVIEKEELKDFLDPSKPVSVESSLTGPRSLFYHYMIQEGILENLLLDGTNIDPSSYSVAAAIREGRTFKTIPPTYITHGTIDDKVPIVQAEDVVKAYKDKGIPVEFDVIPGADHLFDREPEFSMDKMYNFIKKSLKME